MKIFPKIMGIGIVGLLVAAVVVGISMYTSSMVRYYQTEEAKYRAFHAQLVEARSAHLTWLRNITTAIITKKPKSEFTLGTDGHKCNFGQWYYAEGSEVVKTLPKDFQEAFHDLADDHLNVHNSGGELLDMWNPDNLDPAIDLTVHKISPTADTLLGKLSALEKLCEEKLADVQKDGAWWLNNQSLPTLLTLLIGLLILIPYDGLTALGIT
jgi:methyl-accepting chemotaxis protein